MSGAPGTTINPKKFPAKYLNKYTGGIVKEDYCDTDDPLTGKWVIVNDPYWNVGQPGYSLVDDPYIDRLTASPDPHVPLRKSIASSNYRQHKVIPGDQSDEPAGSTSTRTMLVNNSRFGTQTFWPATDGQHYWYVHGHRRHGEGVLPDFPVATPYADGSYQICQFKTLREGGGSDPIIHLNEWGDGYQLIYNYQAAGAVQVKQSWFFPAANNVWVRFRFEILWGLTEGYFGLWSDISGTEKLMAELLAPTLYPNTAGPSANWSHGPYGPLNGLGVYISDYSNFQVLLGGAAGVATETYVESATPLSTEGYWPLDVERGLTDESGNDHDATAGNFTPPWTFADGPGPNSATQLADPAVPAQGVGWIDTPVAPFVNGGDSFTVAGWAYRWDNTTEDVLFAGAGDLLGTVGMPVLRIQAGSDIQWMWSNPTVVLTWAGKWPALNEWIHWLLFVDEVNDVVRLFLNGVEVMPTSGSPAGSFDTTPGRLFFGARGTNASPGGAGRWAGAMGQLMIFNGDATPLAPYLYASIYPVTWETMTSGSSIRRSLT
jgi:hypothetical protein